MRARALILLAALFASPVWAERAITPTPLGASNHCDAAAERAAAVTGVPEHVLKAISRTETGTKQFGGFGPWPWTVNMEGEGRWFDSRAEALDFVRARQAKGARSFDIGCFQVNHLWHGKAFPSVEAMFDPEAGALYAARFLASLKDEFGTWEGAAGAYHSRTPELAAKYVVLFRRMLARLGAPPEPVMPAPAFPNPATASGGVALSAFDYGAAKPLIR